MRTTVFLIGCTLLASGTLVAAGVGTTPAPAPADHALVDAEPSAERLIDRFLDALAKKDPDALHRLRATEAEYRDLLMPGAVPEGQPLKHPSQDFSEFAWGLVDTKSRYYEQSLLYDYGGRRFSVKSTTYEKGEHRFATYTVHGQLRLTLEDETSGAQLTLGTGSIVEVAGRYKFASFVRD
jgi:hypothetical protein